MDQISNVENRSSREDGGNATAVPLTGASGKTAWLLANIAQLETLKKNVFRVCIWFVGGRCG